MPRLQLSVLSLRYSSWSIRAWLALEAVGAEFSVETARLEKMDRQQREVRSGKVTADLHADELASRRRKGSVTGLFPVLWIDDRPVHESMAILEWIAEAFPDAGLWPEDPLKRAQARGVCLEMATGFPRIRGELSCHVFARVPDYEPSPETRVEIGRIFEIWRDLLECHGGPFLGGAFGNLDCMFFPVITRFRTYDIGLPPELEEYALRVELSDPVRAWREVARRAPALPVYDEYIRSLDGDPEAALGHDRQEG
ncbi:MAG TPA: hypothetical protein ENI85_02665 [Deltaproteobacteria bacterium]|nr:hypothetical protein [Deltaproteobacteria bacterium]